VLKTSEGLGPIVDEDLGYLFAAGGQAKVRWQGRYYGSSPVGLSVTALDNSGYTFVVENFHQTAHPEPLSLVQESMLLSLELLQAHEVID
jgi:hypothetical protein